MAIEFTRHEQAQALLAGRGFAMASRILGRRATTAADFEAAFTLERVDLVAEILSREDLWRFARDRVGPRDGVYVLERDEGFVVYHQESGFDVDTRAGLDFEAARDELIERLLMRSGVPYRPPG
ncbi:MAG: hypothetical protein KJP12_06280 [Acidimicrobiia bacterium]|nr:hypothetical protein [Acidimicrobiia bacterium]MBT8214815.1 hypothetical protein [Acidimicrobiia bacterium]NNF68312.1 hypothetical protein [Acidimicrobiia bacterium]NNK92587.1 hypothetical protein [Acidimicrobiia bacterium]